MDSHHPFPAKVLIVDDLEEARWALVQSHPAGGVCTGGGGEGRRRWLCIRHEVPDVVLLDVRLPDMDGFEVLTRVKVHDKTVPVIMVTAYGKTQDAVRAIRAGAYDYVGQALHPWGYPPHRAPGPRGTGVERAGAATSRSAGQADGSLLDCMGKSAAVQRILTEVGQVATTNFSVLLMGETGTGKELVAQAVHARSPRAAQAVRGGGLRRHSGVADRERAVRARERGVHRGASRQGRGLSSWPAEGLSFWMKSATCPWRCRGSCSGFWRTRRIHRIGSVNERDVDFRVVAATNLDLQAMVVQQMFREDLYHRLAEFTISLPPLRERTEDLPFLVNRFISSRRTRSWASRWVACRTLPGGSSSGMIGLATLANCATSCGGRCCCAMTPRNDRAPNYSGCSTDATVRRNVSGPTNRSSIAPGRRFPSVFALSPAALLASGDSLPLKESVGRVTAQVECAILLQTLELTEGNKAQAARLLHIDYKTIHSKLRAYKISSPRFMRDPYKTAGR